MQTYTHVAAGAVLGKILFPHNVVTQELCILGSFVPDVITGVVLFTDKIKKRPPSFGNWPKSRIGYAILHSTLIWCIFLVTSLLLANQFVLAFSIGVLSHIAVDPFTHGGCASNNAIYELDSTSDIFLFPFRIKLGGLVGFWEYRYGHLVLIPKPWEAGIFVALAVVAIYMYL